MAREVEKQLRPGQAIGESTSYGDSKAKNYAILGRISAVLRAARLSKRFAW